MKKQFLSFLLLISLAVGVAAQTAQKQTEAGKNLRKSVAYLASDALEGRRTGETGATVATGYVANMFAKYKLKGGVVKNGKRNFLQPFEYKPRNEKGEVLQDAKALEAYNVVGILEGNDSTLKNEAIVIGAHYDHLGRGGMGSLVANSKEIHHGADDNASGVAAMIELARQFAKSKNNKRTLIFIAFGGEEEGLLGSKFYVNNPAFPIEKTVAMINMDMVGRLKDDKLTVGGIGTASEWENLVREKNSFYPNKNDKNKKEAVVLGSKGAIPVEKTDENAVLLSPLPEAYFDLQLNQDGFGPSDHSSFYGKQIPVLFFFTGTHLDYHKPSDTADKINYEGLEKIMNYVGEIARSIDQNPTRPTYKVAPTSSTGGGRTSFNVTIGVIPGYGDSNDGMPLDGVRDGSPAAIAGLKAGDKIVKFAGKEVKNVQDYTKILGELKADTEYEIEVMRGTERLVFKIKPAARK